MFIKYKYDIVTMNLTLTFILIYNLNLKNIMIMNTCYTVNLLHVFIVYNSSMSFFFLNFSLNMQYSDLNCITSCRYVLIETISYPFRVFKLQINKQIHVYVCNTSYKKRHF